MRAKLRAFWDSVYRWIVVASVAAAALIVMADIDQLLGAVEEAEARSFTATVFTGPGLRFWEISEIQAAFELWRKASSKPTNPLPVDTWVAWHAFTDLFFIAAYAFLLSAAFARVRDRPRKEAPRSYRAPLVLVGVPVTADVLETGLTLGIARTGLDPADGVLIFLRLLSLVKWVGLALVVATIVVLFLNPKVKGAAAFRPVREDVSKQEPRVSLTGLWVLILLFGALVALPAGGPLEQLPDVIRAQFPSWGRWVGAGIAFIGFVAATVVAGWRATAPVDTNQRPAPGNPGMVLGSFLVTLGFALAATLANSHPTYSPMAPFGVILAIAVLAALKRWAMAATDADADADADAQENPAGASGWSKVKIEARRWWTWWLTVKGKVGEWWPVGRWRSSVCKWRASIPGRIRGLTQTRLPLAGSSTAVAGMASMVVLIGALSLIRAAVRPVLLEQQFYGFLAFGIVAACAGPALAKWVVGAAQGRRHTRWMRAAQTLLVLVLLSFYVWLAIAPRHGVIFATNGVVAIAFGVFALVIGEVTFRSRNREVWWATSELGFGSRSPWLAIVMVGWLMIGLAETTGGYHELRDAVPATPPEVAAGDTYTEGGYRNLAEAYEQFKSVSLADDECAAANGRVPMLLVAAPGGGIRAAYWTASVLEELEALSPCGRGNVFAISGVSGGSVGAALWLTSPAGTSPSAQAQLLGEDSALAGTVAALLTRDLLQPFTGIRAEWADRAGIQSQLWIEATRPETEAQEGDGARLDLPWPYFTEVESDGDAASDDSNWVPVVVLNAASVTNGCRVLVANVGGLPASAQSCLDAPTADNAPSGPVTASLDAFTPTAAKCDAAPPTPTIALAALTSARFPLVSPSGAIRQCPPGGDARTSYAVDGGYFENTGLMTLLQLWDEVEDWVDSDVEPWVVLADNGYRSAAVDAAPPRPRELLIPMRTRGANQLVSTAALEQMARSAMASDDGGPRFARLGPAVKPSMTAPLGWVLSNESVASLCSQLTDALDIETDPERNPAWMRLAKTLQSDDDSRASGAEEPRDSCSN